MPVKLLLLIILEAWQSLNAHRLRSFLSMIGIIVGVCAVILTLAVGAGIQADIQKAMQQLGTNTLIVIPDFLAETSAQHKSGEETYLTAADADAMTALPGVVAVAPIAEQQNAQVIAGSNNTKTKVVGSTPGILQVRELSIAEGEMFTENDARTMALVAVLGKTVEDRLFPTGSALGSTIRIQNLSLRVIGILKSKGQSATGQDQDDTVLLPLKIAQRKLYGAFMPGSIWQIMVAVQSPRLMSRVQDAITALLRDRKHVNPENDLPFAVENFSAVAEAAAQSGRAASVFLAFTATISLIVGGVGIMNTMLLSVTERTREIGVRKAIGASATVILAQFLAESVMLSLGGCVMGIALGYGLGYLAAKLISFGAHISVFSVLIAVLAAAVTGIVFGFFPAMKAAHLQPAEALRC